ncbi:MAG TPA: stimulus-sensing domain-containing protein [Alphaproteobacteria bacterium]
MARQLRRRWPGDDAGSRDDSGRDDAPAGPAGERRYEDESARTADADSDGDDATPARAASPSRASPRRPRRRRGLSLTWRILFVNILALAALAGGLLYLDRYRESLIGSELWSLTVQAQIVAEALGEAAVTSNSGEGGGDYLTAMARPLVRRLSGPLGLHVRLFATNGDIIADSLSAAGVGGPVIVQPLPPPDEMSRGPLDLLLDFYEWAIELLPNKESYQHYSESSPPIAADFEEAVHALRGEPRAGVHVNARNDLILVAAAPVSRYKQVLGAVVVTKDSSDIEDSLRRVRLDILQVLAVVMAMSVLVSLYLAGTIARPVRRLAAAAKRVGHGQGRKVAIPDFSRRSDEIGDLSAALREMTDALWTRMDAIERFAADVAHEIKNPLTSLRSAVETVARVEDPDQRRKLLAIIMDDVKRLDRLISDISDASRLDAELSRAESGPVDVGGMLAALADIHATTVADGGPRLVFDPVADAAGEFIVEGLEGRLVQVFRNLIGNAVSFSPPGGEIRLRVAREGGWIKATIEDQGSGIPEDKRTAIFDRFYTERPKGEKFGTHSGLGLSISRQIVEAHRGRIWAENIYDAQTATRGAVRGARFVVELPAAPRLSGPKSSAKPSPGDVGQ